MAGINLELDRGNEAKLRTIISSLTGKPDAALSAEERKLRDFYNAFLDTAAIEAAGLTPVKADLERIAALRSAAEVAAFMATPATRTAGPFCHPHHDRPEGSGRLHRAAHAVRPRHARPRLLPARRTRTSPPRARRIGSTSPTCWRSPASPTRRAQAAVYELEEKHCPGPLAGRGAARRGQDLQCDEPGAARDVSRRSFRGARTLLRPASRRNSPAGGAARRRRRKVGVPETRGAVRRDAGRGAGATT